MGVSLGQAGNHWEDRAMGATLVSTKKWAESQWGTAPLGDIRLVRRAIQMGEAMSRHPNWSLPRQMEDSTTLKAAYNLLNDYRITLEQLSAPHWRQTRQEAAREADVLFLQDTTVLDYSHHRTKKGLGPIGDGRGRGLLLHTALAVVPGETPRLLGMAHQQVVLRKPTPKPRPAGYVTAEGRVWARATEAVGRAPDDVRWVHVGDRGSDDFEFMHRTRQMHADFLIRVKHNRILTWEEDVGVEMRKMKDYARSLPAEYKYQMALPALHKRKARTAQMRLAWARVTIPPPATGQRELRCQPPISAWLIRTWEVNAPLDVDEPLEWILITSVPVKTVEEALKRIGWYSHRWLTEEYHQCLKTGCAIEKRQFDHADDICRLLGFCAPIAVRLLQIRQMARLNPDAPAVGIIDPLTVQILIERLPRTPVQPLTSRDFWRGVAQLGGYQGRRSDGPPGWRTIWNGWQYLNDLVDGARLCQSVMLRQQLWDACQPNADANLDRSNLT
jgi:hypothetical protein